MSDEAATSNILVVDDNEMNRDMLSRRLTRMGYAVITAENGNDALSKVNEGDFDLVLLDIMMPDVSGYEVLEKLKSDDKTLSLPVIMISAVDDLDSVVRCIELGAEDYLFKPFNPVLLRARVRASLDKRQMQQDSEKLSSKAVQTHMQAIKSNVDKLLANDAENADLKEIKTSVDALDGLLSV